MTTIILNNLMNNGQPITTEAELNTALTLAATESAGTYEIDLGSTDIALTTALDAINLQSNVTLDIVGNGATLDGKNESTSASYNQRGLFVYSGVVNISNLTVANTKAIGGAGASDGGGGAGLGGGLFVAGATTAGGAGGSSDPGQAAIPVVTLSNVTFNNDSATGGAGGPGRSGGGGGGLGGPGSTGSAGGPGFGAASFGAGGNGGTNGTGGFGGGGGSMLFSAGGQGGFGGGGGGGFVELSDGNGGVVPGPGGGAGGFGAGAGATRTYGGGGGGLAAGGDIFVQAGATLTITDASSLANGTVVAGSGGGGAGAAYGAGIFLQGNQSISFGTGQSAGQITTINGDITDQSGSDPANAVYNDPGAGQVIIQGAGTVVLGGNNSFTGGTSVQGGTLQISAGHNLGSGSVALNSGTSLDVVVSSGSTTLLAPITGSGRLVKDGAGTAVLAAANTYTGGTTINSGVLEIRAGASAGTSGSIISFGGPAAAATLLLDATVSGSTYADTLANIIPGDQLDLRGLAFVDGATAILSGSTLTVTSGGFFRQNQKFTLVNPGATTFTVTSDGVGATPGVLVTAAMTYTATGANASNNVFSDVEPNDGVIPVLGTMSAAASSAESVTSFDAHLSLQSGSDVLSIQNHTSTWHGNTESVTTSGDEVFVNNTLYGTYSFSNQDLVFTFSSANSNQDITGAILDAVAYQNTAADRSGYTENVAFSFGSSATTAPTGSIAVKTFAPSIPAEAIFAPTITTVATYPGAPVYIQPDSVFNWRAGSSYSYDGSGIVTYFPFAAGINVSIVNPQPGDELLFKPSSSNSQFFLSHGGGDWSYLDSHANDDVHYTSGSTLTQLRLSHLEPFH